MPASTQLKGGSKDSIGIAIGIGGIGNGRGDSTVTGGGKFRGN